MNQRKFMRDNDNAGWVNWRRRGVSLPIVWFNLLVATVGLSARLEAQEAAESQPVEWLIGRKLEQARALALTVRWSDTPIREQLQRLALRQRIGVVLDRRIDPTTPLNLAVSNVTWETLLWQVADRVDGLVARIGDFDYIGPRDRVPAILAAHESSMDRLKRNRRSSKVDWTGRSQWTIPEFSIPAELISELANDAGFSIDGLERVPHDVWAEVPLPPTSLAERFALILAQFDLWYAVSVDGTHCQIVPMPDRSELAQLPVTVRVGRVGLDKGAIDELLEVAPSVTGRRSGEFLVLRGPADGVLQTARAVAMRHVAVRGETQQSIAVTASRGQVLATVAAQLGVELRYEADVRRTLLENVTLDLKNVTEQEIIEAALQGSGLQWKLTDEALQVHR